MSGSTLTAKERAMIRNEFMSRFGPLPKLADGILVKRWVKSLMAEKLISASSVAGWVSTAQ